MMVAVTDADHSLLLLLLLLPAAAAAVDADGKHLAVDLLLLRQLEHDLQDYCYLVRPACWARGLWH